MSSQVGQDKSEIVSQLISWHSFSTLKTSGINLWTYFTKWLDHLGVVLKLKPKTKGLRNGIGIIHAIIEYERIFVVMTNPKLTGSTL